MALADISVFMIRASYVANMAESRCGGRTGGGRGRFRDSANSSCCLRSIADIRMDVAVPESTGSEPALEVEQCACPQGYRGPSCQVGAEFLLPAGAQPLFPLWLQECDEGYTRSNSGLYLGTCGRCSCHGHASSCDPETGSCQVGVGPAP